MDVLKIKIGQRCFPFGGWKGAPEPTWIPFNRFPSLAAQDPTMIAID